MVVMPFFECIIKKGIQDQKQDTEQKKEPPNMKLKCLECDADMDIPDDLIDGEIINCSDCGMDFEANIKENQEIELRIAEIEGEDWGE